MILVVDDNVDAVESLEMVLRLAGHTVHTAYTGEEALVVAEAVRPEVILLDIGLPGISGHDVARVLRAKAWGKAPRIIAITGWSQAEDRRRSAEAGIDLHLTKPVDMEVLERAIKGA